MKFEHLFEPIDLNGFLLRNRITMSAMPTGFSCTKGYVTGKMVSYYARGAKGGASLIVVEGAAVEDRGRIYSLQLMASNDTYLSGLNELAEGIKKSGAFAVLQLQHGGRFAMGTNPVSASDVSFPCPCTRKDIVPVPMTEEDINVTITSFTNAAVLAKKAGFDMVEINGGYGHLLSQFLSPRTNKRSDKYGGSLERRMKLPLDIIELIKGSLGDSLPIGYQLMADELLDGGFSLDEAKVFSGKLEEYGVQFCLNSKLLEITKDKVIIEDDSGEKVALKADLVINASGFNPANDFYNKAKDLVNEVYLIGDAKVPRNIHDAMHEGYQIGLDI